ncbi:putative transposase, partial [Streptomyces coelicolor A3(2)]
EGLLNSVEMSQSTPNLEALTHFKNPARVSPTSRDNTPSDYAIAEHSKNYRYFTNHQVLVDADTRLVVVTGRPMPGNRNDCKAWEEAGANAAVGRTLTIADDWKKAHNKSHPFRAKCSQGDRLDRSKSPGKHPRSSTESRT